MFCSQITGFVDTNVQKGALKAVTFDANAFATATVLEQLSVERKKEHLLLARPAELTDVCM